MSEITIRQAQVDDYGQVRELVYRLLCELFPEQFLSIGDKVTAAAEKILENEPDVTALMALDGEQPAGVIMVNRCTAIYALGDFGEISELYVEPAYRSSGVGAQLIEAAAEFSKAQGWSMLEVGAPHLPEWQRTVDFYQRNGFAIVGPRLYRELD